MRGVWRLKRTHQQIRERQALARALRAVGAFPSSLAREPHGLAKPLVVSLTSYPPRFPTLALTLRSLLDQATMPDLLILWVTPEDKDGLPAEVLDLCEHGLEIATTEELRSYKKLVPALRAFPDSVIVTADDDVYYPPDWLTRLVARSLTAPGTVVGLRCHLARIDPEGRLLPYGEWDYETSCREAQAPQERLFPTGVAGILYPSGSLSGLALDEASFMRLCPTADDLWFFWIARMSGTTHVQGDSYPLIVTWPDSQGSGLFRTNVGETGNDDAIRALEQEFGPVP